MERALLVVDMQNDFLDTEKGTLNMGHDASGLIDRVAAFVQNFDGPVVVTGDSHDKDCCEFEQFPEHCLKDSWGADFPTQLKAAYEAHEDITYVDKESYTSSEVVDALDQLFHYSKGDLELHVTGVCTSICVHDIVASYVNHVKNEYGVVPKVVLHRNMVDDFDPEAAAFTLKRLSTLYGVEVADG